MRQHLFEFEVESLMWMGQNLKAIASNIKPQTLNLCKEFLPGPFGFGFDLFDVQFGKFFMA